MTLPTSRNTTYANGTPVVAADLDDLQDMVIGAKRPVAASPLHLPASMAAAYTGAPVLGLGTWTLGAAEKVVMPIPLNIGDRIVSVEAFLHENAGAAIFCNLWRQNGATGATASINSGSSAGGGTHAQVNLAAGSLPATVIANEYYQLTIEAPAAGQVLYHVEVTWDRL